MVALEQPVVGVNQGRLHAEAREDGGKLHSGRATAQDDQASGQLAGRSGLTVRPGTGRGETLDRWHLGRGAGCHDDRAGLQSLDTAADDCDLDQTRSDDPGVTPVCACAGFLEPAAVARVVRPVAILAVDHVVAAGRCALPRVRSTAVLGRCVEQRLRRKARPERARPTEQFAIHHGDALAAPARGSRCGLSGGACADDHEVETIHRLPPLGAPKLGAMARSSTPCRAKGRQSVAGATGGPRRPSAQWGSSELGRGRRACHDGPPSETGLTVAR